MGFYRSIFAMCTDIAQDLQVRKKYENITRFAKKGKESRQRKVKKYI